MSDVPSLPEIIHPMTVEDFLRDHFEGAPLHVRGGADRFRGLFSSAELFGLVRSRPIPSFSMSPPDDDGRIFAATGARPTLRLDPRDVEVALAAGATLMLDDLQKYDARMARLAAGIKQDLALPGRTGVVAFYSPPRRGVPIHMDGGATFIFHLEGHKTWRLSKSPQRRWPRVLARQLADGTPVLEASKGAPPDVDPWEAELEPLTPEGTMEVTLGPGDLLYVPPGAWHGTTADAAPTFSVNVHFHPLHPAELFLEAMKGALGTGIEWRRVPPCAGMPGEGMPAHVASYFRGRLRELRAALDTMSEERIERSWKKLLAESDDGPPRVESPAPVKERDRLRLSRGAPIAFQVERAAGAIARVRLYKNDREIEFDEPDVMPLAEAVIGGEPFVAGAIAARVRGQGWDSVASMLGALLAEGIVERA